MKDLINVLEIIIIANALWKVLRFLRGKKHKRTLLGKLILLVSRRLHSELDSKLQEQNKKLAGKQANERVIQLRNYKRQSN